MKKVLDPHMAHHIMVALPAVMVDPAVRMEAKSVVVNVAVAEVAPFRTPPG